MTHFEPRYNPRQMADIAARILLATQAVHFNATPPFIFTSGWASPVYVDCRKLISFPSERRTLIEMAESIILNEIGIKQIDSVAGGETAGIPFAAWIADRLMLPMQYVRKKPKGFGREAQIEGELKEGARVLLVEDLTTDGRSKLNFCQALRRAGASIHHLFVLFNYAVFDQRSALLKSLNVELHALATWWDILRISKETQYFNPAQLTEIEKFLQAPAEWSVIHGGSKHIKEHE